MRFMGADALIRIGPGAREAIQKQESARKLIDKAATKENNPAVKMIMKELEADLDLRTKSDKR